MINPSELTTLATETAKKAGSLLAQGFGTNFEVSSKEGAHNLVTSCDKESEKLIISTIKERYPHHAFLAEEGGASGENQEGYLWVIDPLDGTVNFAHSIPLFSVSIACIYNGELQCGVVYNPISKELFVAEKGKGATLNGAKLTVSSISDLQESILISGFPYNVCDNPLHCIDTFAHIIRQGIPVRRLGSAALDLCYLAAGRFTGYFEVSLEPWDIAAGMLIVEEAGGVVTHYDGTPHTIFEKGTVLASNGLIHESLKKEINAYSH